MEGIREPCLGCRITALQLFPIVVVLSFTFMSTKVVAAFLDRVERSGLITEPKLSQLRQELEVAGVDLGNPHAITAALVDRGALTQWQTEKLLQGKHKGFFLGSYRLLRPLGKGGMGAVFLAQHEMMRRQCAIKVLPQTQIDKHSSVLERFYVEAQAVASLDHQNIVRAYDVNKEVKENKEIHYLVMEFVEGQDAQGMVQESGALDYVKAAEIIRQTANGLAHAHENGLIHRDIKPANLLIDKKGVVKILDLGLARFHDDSRMASLTAAHNETVLGTADYLSPEQALNSHNVDPRTDIYSLGCTAYFLLTGHPPFPEGSVAQRLVAHQVKQPKPIAEERPDAPPELAALIGKMMAKSPDDRFQSASEVATILAAWLVQHGGEDWRRQHSEITGDSSILSLVSQHREPTRAMASPMSETELEFAPLDDGAAEPQDRPAPAAAKRKGSGTRLAGKSGAAIEVKPSDDVDLTLAEEEEMPAPAIEAAPSPQSERSERAVKTEAPAAVLEELPPLPESPDASPLAAPDLLAELPSENALASLDQVDLLGSDQSGPALGAMESHVKLAPARGPSSSARLKSKPAAEPKPKTLLQNTQAVGLPILIGVGGGLLLVLVIILLILFSSPSNDLEVTRRRSPGAGADASLSQPAEPTGEGIAPGDVAAAGTAGLTEVQPQPSEAASQPEPAPAEPPKAIVEPEKAEAKPPQAAEQPTPAGAGPDGSRPKKKGRAQPPEAPAPAAVPSEPAKMEPSAPAKPEPAAPSPQSGEPPGGAVPVVEPAPTPAPPAAPQKPPLELFAGLTECVVEVKFGGDPKNVPKNLAAGLEFLAQGIRTKLQASERNIDLRVVEQSNQAVMEVVMTPSADPPHLVLNLKAELKCRTPDGGSVVVWSADSQNNPKPEVFRFIPTQFNPSLTPKLWEEKVIEFFKPLGKVHREAKSTLGK